MLKLPPDIKDIKKEDLQIIIFLSLVCLIIIVLYFNFIFAPQMVRVGGVIMKMGKAKADLKAAESNVAKIPELEKNVGFYREKIDKYEKMLPSEKDIPELLEDLSGIAKSSNVKIIGITPVIAKEDKPKKGQIYKEVPIQISASSSYHELGIFLSKLENSDRFMKVADIEIKESTVSAARHDVELMVMTYVLLNGK